MWFLHTRETFWFLFFLSFNHVFLVHGTDICTRTFSQAGNTFEITCPERCISWPFENRMVVFGTSAYHPDSLICLSALHAGVARIGASTPLTFNKTETQQKFEGTVYKRVVSEDKVKPGQGFYFKNDRFIQTDRADTDELVMVHNNNQQSGYTDDYAACLPNSLEALKSSSVKPEITRWDFNKIQYDEVFGDSKYGNVLGVRIASTRGTRLLGCMGSNIGRDIMAIFGKHNDQYEATFPTVTASLGESVTAPFLSNYGGARVNKTINSVSPSNQRYFLVGESFSRIIVRGCKKDRFGANCSGWCRDCLNNGECDSDTGECVCSSGTRGKNCQIFCPATKFGTNCQLDCNRIYSLWKKGPRRSCSDLTFCLRNPKGCSCQPGFKPPRCNTECDAGSYGSDCLSRCDYCYGSTCDRYGRCDQGCKNVNLCKEDKVPLNLPRFRKPPLITDCDIRGCAVTFSDWDSDYDDGELSDTDGGLRYEISIENLDKNIANAYIPTYPGQRRDFSYNFVSGISYKIKLNILTNRGKATEEYNMRIHSQNITLFSKDERLVLEEQQITSTVGESLHQTNQYVWIVPMTVILVVIALLLIGMVIHRSRREMTRTPEENEVTRNNELESTLYEIPLKEIEDEAVSYMNLEGYLNLQITSNAAIEKFMAIPKSYLKSTSDAESNENLMKNRNRNYIYNDTRVRLQLLDGDPSSDYINANHITSVSKNRRYIASQGPKDCNVCTIADFWRMVIEQNVNVIIMVANYIEKGIAKVGEYVRHDFLPLNIQSPEGIVTVMKREITSFCVISTVQVRIIVNEKYVQREVTHYHFSQWPDHGAPTELRTLSQMILHIATKHVDIHAVVHSSAGIGRTGVVLFCLICHDYLLNKRPLDIFKVIRQLRADRGRLIENQVQFKLCLNLLDEMMFGTQNSFPIIELSEKLLTSKQECSENYQRLARLPNSLNCSIASHPDNFIHRGSKSEMLNINAVKFQGLEIGIEYISIQHPFKTDQGKFWNLVHSNRISKIVLLNNEFDENLSEFYPSVVGSSFEVDNNVIKCTSRNSLSPNLVVSEIAVETRKKEFHKINVYEVQNWERGALHPLDLTETVSVADILLSEKDDRPPVFVCGDGVTACGLMIGIINTIDRLSVFQDIDVYRTAVMLRRCHPNAIVNQVQLVQMMEAAKVYIENYSVYGNPNDFRV